MSNKWPKEVKKRALELAKKKSLPEVAATIQEETGRPCNANALHHMLSAWSPGWQKERAIAELPKVPPKGKLIEVPSAELVTGLPTWQNYRPSIGYQLPEGTRVAEVNTKAGVIRVIVIPDTHVPFHDKLAWACTLEIVRVYQPDLIVIIGDFMDAEGVSMHGKNAPEITKLSEEYFETNMRLDELQNAAPNAEYVYIEGNHENRVTRWMNEFGSIAGLLDVPEQLYIKPRANARDNSMLRKMTWVPLDQRTQPHVINGVAYLHGMFESTGHAAAHALNLGALLTAQGVFEIVYGHMHGFQCAISPAGVRAQCCGFLGDKLQRVFQAYTKGRPRPWSEGILAQEIVPPKSGARALVSNTEIRIVNGRAVFNGMVFG